MNYEVNGTRLSIFQQDGSIKETSFAWPIAQVIEIEEVLVVRVEPRVGATDNQNVFGVGLDGSLLWQVARQLHSYKDSPYTNISTVSEGVLLSNWDGTQLVLAPTDGVILSLSQGK